MVIEENVKPSGQRVGKIRLKGFDILPLDNIWIRKCGIIRRPSVLANMLLFYLFTVLCRLNNSKSKRCKKKKDF